MLVFSRPEITDKLWVKPILQKAQRQGCDFSFGNILIWSFAYTTKIANFNGCFLAKSVEESGECTYAFPVGERPLTELINTLIDDAAQNSDTLRLCGLTADDVEKLSLAMPDKFYYTSKRDFADYIYLVEDLACLSGRKYHSKRNHISFFENNFKWKYEEIDKSNIDECFEMNKKWLSENLERDEAGLITESQAVKKAFENYFELDFKGGLLRTDGRVVAYTMGEKLNDLTFCTHIEKADADIRGAYPMINKQFALNTISSYKYVNREEDLGNQGLRRAKESYKPAYILDKSVAVYKG